MTMGIRRGASLERVQVGGKSSHAPLLVPVASPELAGEETAGCGGSIAGIQSLSAAVVTTQAGGSSGAPGRFFPCKSLSPEGSELRARGTRGALRLLEGMK